MDKANNAGMLAEQFRSAGSEYGYDAVDARFTAFKDLKVRWQRTFTQAEFDVSDYLSDAPAEVLRGLATSLFRRICGELDDGYPQSLCDWVSRPEFHRTYRPTYLKRSRNLAYSPVGQSFDLQDVMGRLRDAGLADGDEDVCLTWTKTSSGQKVARCSVLMKVIMVSSALDGPDVPQDVVDFAVYHELCHVKLGFDPTGKKHNESFDSIEERFGDRKKDAVRWLSKRSRYV